MEGSRKKENLGGGGFKGKSCKGCLYYSSIRKSKERRPLCVGISRTLQLVPSHIVGESEAEASKEGRSLTDFKYACVGYSVHMDAKDKDPSTNPLGKRAELPFCIGIELLVDKRPVKATAGHAPGHAPAHVPGRAPAHAPAHARKTEDGQPFPQPQSGKPPLPAGEEFLPRFTRNATLVASGVLKNVYRVGNYVKANVDDMLYPYRRRPK
ncbi:hypothetical protein MKW94_010767 [Papaver nudicaule]|uniref:DUF8204 domain-containing protein n=1 Tax=Papaver nudicaule TaxID=74823 RepID=A0AA41RW08_PAPNU|nr:hypothetical protein [Papaver nudicaule]